MSTVKLEKKIIYKGILKLKTGLHIGGTNASLNIGGPDNFVVRNPLTNKPYIPGSSLKGKMRALIEIKEGCCSPDNQASNDACSPSGKLFGTAGNSQSSRPSRIIVRDAGLITTAAELKELRELKELADYPQKFSDCEVPDFENTDLPYTESKTEVNINRVTAQTTPRTFERVPAGALFKVTVILNIFTGEDEKELKGILDKAKRLLEDDYLGGNGSRGYGEVAIEWYPYEETYSE